MEKYHALFQPIQIGGVTLKNRVILTAMGATSPFGHDGKFDPKVIPYYLDRAKGNVALIIPGVTQVVDHGVYLYEKEDVFRGPVKSLMEQLHSYGTKFFLQVGAGFGRVQFFGLDSTDETLRHELFVAPSEGLQNVWQPNLKHRELTKDEIHKIVEAYGKTAKICKEAGIDGIEIHAVHEGYLLDQFAITNTNWRTDEYGGSLENRMRFTCEIIRAIKDAAGEDYPVSVRFSAASKMRGFNQGALPAEPYEEFGRTLEESPAVAQILEKAGADLLNADNGSYDSWWWAHPPVYMPLHCNFPEVSYLKKFVKIPVFCAGRMEDPDFSSKAIENGEIDGIGVARQFLADPFWLNKVREGKQEEIRPCIACHNGCFPIGKIPCNDGRTFIMSHCALRPATMDEELWKLVPTENPKKVAVVGGGIGGMECARLLKMRGHSVTLFEKSGELGGVFIAAAAPSFKEKDRMLVDWYRHQMELNEIDVRMNTEATTQMLVDFDVVVAATGSAPRKLNLPGVDNPKVMQAVEYLRGQKQAGENVVIVGGGLTGIEIAYQLVLDGKKPSVVEMLPDILQVPGLCAANSDMLREIIRFYKIPVYTGAALSSIRDEGGLEVTVKTAGGEKVLSTDSVILSVGYIPQKGLTEKLEAAGKKVYTIGDAKKIGNLMSAIYDAYRVAYEI